MNRCKNGIIMFLTAFISVSAAAAGYTAYLSKDRVYAPVSEHFDGKRFRNPIERKITGADIRKWHKESKKNRVAWPEYRNNDLTFPPPPERFGEPGKTAITFIGHSTFLIQTENLNIITDPFYSERASPIPFTGPKRVHPPGIPFNDLPKIDIVLISHNHYDHLDIPTIKRLWYRDKPKILVPLGDDRVIGRNDINILTTPMDWNGKEDISPDISVNFVRTQHWSSRTPYDRNKSLWGAFVIKTSSAGNIYFGGDTGYGDGSQFTDAAKKFGSFSAALLPIGAYNPRWFMSYSHMNPEEAVMAMKDLNAGKAIGMHFGTIQLTDEGIDDPGAQLNAAIKNAKPAPETFITMKPGESRIFGTEKSE